MTHPTLIEALLAGAIASGLCRELQGWTPATGEVLPAQYLLLVRDRPRIRAQLRRAARGLLTLLDIGDQAYAGPDADGCARFRALAAAPEWLLHPSEPDDSDPDVALIWEREVSHGGDWCSLLEALHVAGSREWQWSIRRCRVLMRFERETGIDLAELVRVPGPPVREQRHSRTTAAGAGVE